MHQESRRYIYIVIVVSMVLSAVSGTCFSDTQFKTAVIVSKKIKPYLHVVDGITDEMAVKSTQMDVFFLASQNENPDTQVNDQIASQLQAGQYDLVAAIGPEAAVLTWGLEIPLKKFYVVVLDPVALPGLTSDACGISLRIPVDVQVEKIAQTFHTLKKIGLLFDPRHNQWFYDQAVSTALGQGIEIIALPVDSKNQIAGVLTENKGKIDAIWMIPDQTIISEKIIHYVIKQGIYHHMGVIGYNSFFTRSGAVFSFEFDYQSLGRQAGEAITAYLETGVCRQDSPVFDAIINQKMADIFGIRVTK